MNFVYKRMPELKSNGIDYVGIAIHQIKLAIPSFFWEKIKRLDLYTDISHVCYLSALEAYYLKMPLREASNLASRNLYHFCRAYGLRFTKRKGKINKFIANVEYTTLYVYLEEQGFKVKE